MKTMLKTFLLNSHIIASIHATHLEPSSEKNLQTLQKILEYGDVRAVAHMEEFFAETVRVHNELHPEGKDFTLNEITQSETHRVETLLSKEWKLLDTFVSENVIIAYLLMHGIHLKEYLGLPATGKEFIVPVVFIYRFDNGKICEVWNSWDKMTLLKQLGEIHVTPKSE